MQQICTIDTDRELICGRFEVLGLLTEGQKNPVYLVSDESQRASLRSLQILTAARIFSNLPANIREYLHQEVSVSEQLRHANIVSLYEVVESNGLSILTMEYVPGISFQNCSEKLFLTSFQILNLSIQLFGALSFFHSHGISHGKLGPQHVTIRNDGVLKVALWAERLPADSSQALDCAAANQMCLDLLSQPASLLEGSSGRRLRSSLLTLLEDHSEIDSQTRYQSLIRLIDTHNALEQNPVLTSTSLEAILDHSSRIRASQSITVVLILGCIVSAMVVLLAHFGEQLCILFC